MFASDLKHNNRSLQDKLEMLFQLKTGDKIALGFRTPYLELLDKLDNPHLRLPPTIHVAGTNGKGSTIAMLRSVLQSAGYSVHTYTSPHLIKFNERINLNGTDISDNYLESLIDEALTLNAGAATTFFEITTAIAFKAFADTKADILLLETGLGGRLDCTNVIENPLLTIITRIAHDHCDLLGDTIQEIAREKAGIIKDGIPCIVSKNDNEVMEVLNKHPVLTVSNNVELDISLIGDHQQENATTAIAALKAISDKFPVTEKHIKHGLANISWQARLQNITAHIPSTPKSTQIYLDGGHNQNAAEALVNWINSTPTPVYLICGMMPHKDANAYINTLTSHCESLQYVAITGETETELSWQQALQNLSQDQTPKRILIGGSLYLAGDVLRNIIA